MSYKIFYRSPAPVLDVSVGEREIAPLIVSVGRQVIPHVWCFVFVVINHEGAVVVALLVLVGKAEYFRRRWGHELRVFRFVLRQIGWTVY